MHLGGVGMLGTVLTFLCHFNCASIAAVQFVIDWQIQRESAALARAACDPDFPSQKTRQFGAYRETQAGTPELAAGRSVGLPKSFENNLLLVFLDAYAGIDNRKCRDPFRFIEPPVSGSPTL